MTMLFIYPSKKELKANVGKPLRYEETSMFGPEYKKDGVLYGSNRPSITRVKGREFFAKVTMADGVISKVE